MEKNKMNENAKKIAKWTLTSLLLGIIIGAMISYASTPTFTTYLMPGSMVETATYLVFKDSSVYYVKNGLTGAIDYSGSNASEIINGLVGNYTHIYLKATYDDPIYLDSPISIPADTFFLTFEGTGGYEEILWMAPASNCNMFIVAEDCHQIRWVNLGMNGDKNKQTGSSNGITFYNGGTTTDCHITSCTIVAFNGHCIYTETELYASFITDNYLENSVTAIRAHALINCQIRNNYFWGNDEGIYIYSSPGNSQDNIIIGNQFSSQANQAILVYNSSGNVITDNWFNLNRLSIDMRNSTRTVVDANHIKATTEHGIYLYSCNETLISNNEISGSSYLNDNTYDGIWIGAGNSGKWASYYNVIQGNVISSYGYLNNMKYGIDELGSGLADNNTYIGNTVRYADTDDILVQGSNSKVYLGWEGDTWIPGHDQWLSPAEEYLPLMFRVEKNGLIYYEDPYFIIRCHNGTNDLWCSWLAFGETYGYGTYEWKMKAVNQTYTAMYFGFEYHHGWLSEGILSILWDNTTWSALTSHAGSTQQTSLNDIDFSVERTIKIEWNATAVLFYVDGVLEATHTTYVPNGYEMQLFCEIGFYDTPADEPFAYWREGSFHEIS